MVHSHYVFPNFSFCLLNNAFYSLLHYSILYPYILMDLAPYRKSNQISDVSLCFSSYHAKDHFVFCHSDRFECINQIVEMRENFFCGFTFYNMVFLAFLDFFAQVTISRIVNFSVLHHQTFKLAPQRITVTKLSEVSQPPESSIFEKQRSTHLKCLNYDFETRLNVELTPLRNLFLWK